jgi:hypothetical protein
MGDVTLSTGEKVRIDTSKFTNLEWRTFFRGTGTDEADYAFIEKATGIKAKKWDDMLRDDSRRIVAEIRRVGNEPLADPNSQSESTSD